MLQLQKASKQNRSPSTLKTLTPPLHPPFRRSRCSATCSGSPSSPGPWPSGPAGWPAPSRGRTSRSAALWTGTPGRQGAPPPRWSPAAGRSSRSACGGSRAPSAACAGSAQSSGSPWRGPCDRAGHSRRRSPGGGAAPARCSAWGSPGPASCLCSATSSCLHAAGDRRRGLEVN